MIDITGLREDKRPQSSTVVHALLDRLEAAEKERDAAELMSLALQAKIAEMERQEPVAKVESWTNGSYTRHYKLKWLRDVNEGAKLYALPGAQPAPSVPDFANTKDAARYRWLRENGLANEKRESRAVLPRSGKKASMAFRYWTTPEELDMTIDAMISAAPEAKP